MGIWVLLTKEYFCRFEKGTSTSILSWILKNNHSNLEQYFGEKYDKNYSKYSIFRIGKILKEEWVNNCIRQLWMFNPVTPTLVTLFKQNKLQRKESNSSSSKWEYYYPT